MKKWFLVAACSLSLTGCAGLLVAGAATTANIVSDTRTTQEQWQDSQLEFEVAGIGNKALILTRKGNCTTFAVRLF